MDLRSVLNTSDNGDRAPPKQAPPTPQQQPHPRQQQQHQSRPSQSQSQSPSQYGPRDYGHQAPHPSPGKPAPQEYPRASPQQQHRQHPQGGYMPPSPYQAPGPYPPQSGPPPLQHTSSFHDARSPSGSISGPAQSPYRPTPTATGPAAGYPFPPSQQGPHEMTSPSQRHQYPPSQAQPVHQRRDSYSQGQNAAHGPPPFAQQPQHAVPQTPPIATSATSQYMQQQQQQQQQPLSAHSTPTPTSAHSQHQYGPPAYAQGSPSAASAHLPPNDYNRPPSQPPTPLGPPQPAGQRQPGAPGSFAQPPSPYQQRLSSIPSQSHPSPKHPVHAQPPAKHPHRRTSSSHGRNEIPDIHQPQQPQQQPPPPPPPPQQQQQQQQQQRRPSLHEREPSMSVSPKTQLGSLPSTSSRRTSIVADAADPRSMQAGLPASRASVSAHTKDVDAERAMTPAKRKMEDRSSSPGSVGHRSTRPSTAEVNGGHAEKKQRVDSPTVTRKKRQYHAQPPIWAQSAQSLGKNIATNANFVLQKRIHSHIHSVVNGKHDGAAKAEHGSRQATPTTPRSQPGGTNGPTAVAAVAEPGPQEVLGPWEPSITGVKPYEEFSKTVADFLFIHVVNSPDINEVLSRGDQFEIEAKLGTLIDRDTNHRVDRLLDSECILHDTGRVNFRSSMTEVHHKSFNDFLNQMVVQTDPRAPNGGSRVQVHYKHRREVDRYFELSHEMQNRLPGAIRSRVGTRGKRPKVRVTYDQKSGEILAKIIKARVADIDIHMPMCPMDCRISINLEMNWDGPMDELEQLVATQAEKSPDRNKDRLSYKQGHYQVDLTQVTLRGSGQGQARNEKEHELEIELDAATLIEQGRKAMSGAPHRYQELVDGLVDNVRILARKAREFK